MAVAGAADGDTVSDAEHRRPIFKGLGHAGVGVLHTRGVDSSLESTHPDAVAGGDSRVGVGNRNGVTVIAHHYHRHALPAQGVVHPTNRKR